MLQKQQHTFFEQFSILIHFHILLGYILILSKRVKLGYILIVSKRDLIQLESDGVFNPEFEFQISTSGRFAQQAVKLETQLDSNLEEIAKFKQQKEQAVKLGTQIDSDLDQIAKFKQQKKHKMSSAIKRWQDKTRRAAQFYELDIWRELSMIDQGNQWKQVSKWKKWS